MCGWLKGKNAFTTAVTALTANTSPQFTTDRASAEKFLDHHQRLSYGISTHLLCGI
jgi:hypothetical protein